MASLGRSQGLGYRAAFKSDGSVADDDTDAPWSPPATLEEFSRAPPPWEGGAYPPAPPPGAGRGERGSRADEDPFDEHARVGGSKDARDAGSSFVSVIR